MKQTIKSKALVAGAITGGLAGASHAATVQITLTGNTISSTGGDQLVADVTGDGTDDVTFDSPVNGRDRAQLNINGSFVYAFVNYSAYRFVDARFGGSGVGIDFASGTGTLNIKFLNPVTFTDPRINGNQATNGYLEVNSIAAGTKAYSVTLTRFVFDDASTARPMGVSTGTQYTEAVLVPEPSSLTLLALGAGGLLARRNRKKAA